jgi:hypothetical protein
MLPSMPPSATSMATSTRGARSSTDILAMLAGPAAGAGAGSADDAALAVSAPEPTASDSDRRGASISHWATFGADGDGAPAPAAPVRKRFGVRRAMPAPDTSGPVPVAGEEALPEQDLDDRDARRSANPHQNSAPIVESSAKAPAARHAGALPTAWHRERARDSWRPGIECAALYAQG